MDSEKVSIVLPTYNGSKLIRGSIDSCLGQTHKNLELIVVDDCSTDDTPEIIKSYKDPRIRYFRNEKNQRLPRSLNIGFSHSVGQYLTWTSDDNEYSPDAIEKMLNCLQKNPEVQFVYSDVWNYYEDTGKKERMSLGHVDLKTRNNISGSFMYTRKVYETIGKYNLNYEMVEDYDYWFRIFKQFKTAHLAEPVYLYRYHAKSLTTTRVYEQRLFDIILKYRNGAVPAPVLGWFGADYLARELQSGRAMKQKAGTVMRVFTKIAALSPLFFLWFLLLCAYYLLRKTMKVIFLKG